MEIEVHHKKNRRRHLLPSQLMPVDNEHRQHKGESGGKDAVSAADVEIAQIDGAGLFFFLEQQGGNQEPGNYEKYPDPEVCVSGG